MSRMYSTRASTRRGHATVFSRSKIGTFRHPGLSTTLCSSLPSFLPDLCNGIEEYDGRQMLQSYKLTPVNCKNLGEIDTAFIGPTLKEHSRNPKDEPETTNPPFLLLHGFDSNSLEWRRTYSHLQGHGEVFAVDQLGSGFTDVSQYINQPERTLTAENIRDHLFAFWKARIGSPVTLVGCSLGGAAAIEFCVEYPEAVSSLVLINSQGYIDGFGLSARTPRFMAEAGFNLLRSQFIRDVGTKAGFYNKDLASEDAIRVGLSHAFNEGWMEAKLAYLRSNGYSVGSEKVRRIKKPTLLLWGENDEVLDTSVVRQFREDIEGVQTRVFEQCGHFLNVEKGSECAAAILEFVRENSGTPAVTA